MTDPATSEALDFDRADIAPEVAQMSCASCSTPIASTYYSWNQAHLCPSCHEQLAAQHKQGGSFWLAFVYGAAAAAAGALIYYGIRALSHGSEFGLIALFIGIAVGKAVRKGAGFTAKKRYRALAVLLTYLSITATYVPLVMKDLETGSIVVASLVAFIMPVLMLTSFENIMGLIILGIGIYEAWKLSAPPQIAVHGPFTLGAPVAPAVTSSSTATAPGS